MISVIICTYNSSKTIEKCIRSIIDNKIEKEIIVIDANSSDGTLNIVNPYDRYVSLIKNKEKISLGVAREIGIKTAKGEYICFIDSDVIIPEDWFKKALNVLNKKQNIGGVGGPGISPYKDKVSKNLNLLLYGKTRNDKETTVYSLPTMDVIYKKEAIEGLAFNKNLWMGEDVDFSFKIIKRGYKLILSNDLWVYHYHPTTIKKMLIKWYRYGLFYRFPYKKHKDMKTKIYFFRILYMPYLLLLMLLSSFSFIFQFLFVAQIILVLLIYATIGIKNTRLVELPDFIIIHSLKQYSQMLGIFVSFFRGNKSLGNK